MIHSIKVLLRKRPKDVKEVMAKEAAMETLQYLTFLYIVAGIVLAFFWGIHLASR